MTIFLEKEPDLADGITASIAGGGCRQDTIDVPADATNLTVSVGIISQSPGGGPVTVTVCPPGGACQTFTVGSGTNSITIDKYSNPPLNAGTYVVNTCNTGTGSVKVYILATLGYDLNWGGMIKYSSIG